MLRNEKMTIAQTDEGWIVQAPDLRVLAGPFATNREAWRALDDIERQPVSPQEDKTDWLWRQRVSTNLA